MARREWKWTEHQLDKLNAVQTVLNELQEYAPLTLRQIYYQLVSREIIENKKSEYGMLSKLLKYARIDKYISWDVIEDRVRSVHSGAGWSNENEFVGQELDDFLESYRRHLVQDQDKFIEVWIEKDALSRLFFRLTSQYCISTVVCRGFSSVTFLNDFKERISYDRNNGKEPIMLYFGDFDPSGNEMLRSMQETLNSEMGLEGIKFKRIALTEEDIKKYKLPINPNALKRTDTRAQKHLERYGDVAVELDALSPGILEQKIRDAIELELDMDLFGVQQRIQKEDIRGLAKLKRKVTKFMGGES